VEREVLRIVSGEKEVIKDSITDEAFLTIHVNNRELVTLSCTPEKLKELTVGFLYSSGLIRFLDDIENVTVNTKDLVSIVELKNKNFDGEVIFKKFYSSGCGRGTVFFNVLDYIRGKAVTSDVRISARKVEELMKVFERRSTAFRRTGGVHSAALSDGEQLRVFCEDIGRHNAIDKIIGEALYRDVSMPEMIVMTSGRISSDVIHKVQKTGSPIIVSRSAPTSAAIEFAEKCNLTLVGFARGKKMNVYTSMERIL